MTILFTAIAIATAPPAASGPAVTSPTMPAMAGHAEQAQHGKADTKPSGDGCPCCKDMAKESNAKHVEGHAAAPSAK